MEIHVANHYGQSGLGPAILEALAADGKDVEQLTVADLAPVDEFHVRGREATLELAELADLSPEHHVLDIGSGIGGSARHLAHAHGCSVTGIDLTPEYCEVATMLSARVGLSGNTTFKQASALDLPFPAGSFDRAWTEHVQMNIADKRSFYAEIARVLRPGGRLVFHDIFAGPGGEPHFPVPWAEVPELSSLIAPSDLAATLTSLGYSTIEWRDVTIAARDFFARLVAREKRPKTSIALLMGATAPEKIHNILRNLEEKRVTVLQCALQQA